jgi:hypothetical protein
MAEPSTTTVGLGLGLSALLAGAFGVLVADVIMVVLSSIAGCYLSFSGSDNMNYKTMLKYMVLSILLSLSCSWGISELVVKIKPSLNTPYLPSIISLLLGAYSDKLFKLRLIVLNLSLSKLTKDNKNT